MLPFHIRTVPVTVPLAEIVRRLEELQAPVLYGYRRCSPGSRRSGRPAGYGSRQGRSPPPARPARPSCGRRSGRFRRPAGGHVRLHGGPRRRRARRTTRSSPSPRTSASSSSSTPSTGPSRPARRPRGCWSPTCSTGCSRSSATSSPTASAAQPPATARLPPRPGPRPGRRDLLYPGGTLHLLVVRSVLVQSLDVLEYQVRQTPWRDRADRRGRAAARPRHAAGAAHPGAGRGRPAAPRSPSAPRSASTVTRRPASLPGPVAPLTLSRATGADYIGLTSGDARG